ncbi:MAG TPA: hypothetical protein VN688_16440 [Gemmataceae bacterium]|nr:hypothetical protein [Gemmataceae bacterium]
MTELPLVRQEHGFQRTTCGCAFCTVYCRHMPGTLDPSDLPRLCPAGQEVHLWAEQHLRALIDRSYPTLVPARNSEGHCHWYFGGRCAVHENAPYSCAFFDAHMPDAEVDRRAAATIQACKEDAAANGLYHRVWLHLRARGLIGQRGDRASLIAEARRIRHK